MLNKNWIQGVNFNALKDRHKMTYWVNYRCEYTTCAICPELNFIFSPMTLAVILSLGLNHITLCHSLWSDTTETPSLIVDYVVTVKSNLINIYLNFIERSCSNKSPRWWWTLLVMWSLWWRQMQWTLTTLCSDYTIESQ